MNKQGPMHVTVAYPSSSILAEGPIWHDVRKSFLWVDIEGQLIHELQWLTRQIESWPMPHRIGMLVIINKDETIIALQGGLAKFNLETKQLDWLQEIEKDLVNNRPNDGKCDAYGRLWMGTMDVQTKAKAGSFYCIDKHLSVTKKVSGLTISNGLAWSADNKRLYLIDSSTYQVDCYLFDIETTTIIFERTVITVPHNMGMPDGMAIDEEGMLWIAHWNGFSVCRWDPHTGKLLDKISIPVPQVTSCTFGGDNLDHLFITTAKEGLSEDQLLQYPLSGHVFITKCYVSGTLANKMMGTLPPQVNN
jgi:sugar lactone lactonase YvrE